MAIVYYASWTMHHDPATFLLTGLVSQILVTATQDCPANCEHGVQNRCKNPSISMYSNQNICKTCTSCDTGYFLENGICKTCDPGYYRENGVCRTCDIGYFLENRRCRTCDPNFSLENGICKRNTCDETTSRLMNPPELSRSYSSVYGNHLFGTGYLARSMIDTG